MNAATGTCPCDPFGLSETDAEKVLDIKLDDTERTQGCEALEELLQRNGMERGERKVIGLFRNARFDKRISDGWWQQWFDTLNETAPVIVVDILSPDVPEPLNDGVVTFSEKNLRKLGAFMAALDAFVCADTGPMHLAAASGATTLALFNKTEAAVYGTLGENNLTIDMDGLDVKTIVERQLGHIA